MFVSDPIANRMLPHPLDGHLGYPYAYSYPKTYLIDPELSLTDGSLSELGITPIPCLGFKVSPDC